MWLCFCLCVCFHIWNNTHIHNIHKNHTQSPNNMIHTSFNNHRHQHHKNNTLYTISKTLTKSKTTYIYAHATKNKKQHIANKQLSNTHLFDTNSTHKTFDTTIAFSMFALMFPFLTHNYRSNMICFHLWCKIIRSPAFSETLITKHHHNINLKIKL